MALVSAAHFVLSACSCLEACIGPSFAPIETPSEMASRCSWAEASKPQTEDGPFYLSDLHGIPAELTVVTWRERRHDLLAYPAGPSNVITLWVPIGRWDCLYDCAADNPRWLCTD